MDDVTIRLYKSEQLRKLKLGNDLPSCLNQWTELVSSMDRKPDDDEIYLLFCGTNSQVQADGGDVEFVEQRSLAAHAWVA